MIAGDKLSRMAESDEKADLLRYLQIARESLVWKLDGVSEYDVRRPLVPTGTTCSVWSSTARAWNSGTSATRSVVRRASRRPWLADDAEIDGDMWATPDESRDDIVDFYKRTWAHADATINSHPLDAAGSVPWWPENVAR